MKAGPRGALLTQKSSFLSHFGGPLGEPHSRGRRRTASPHWEPAQWGSALRSRRRSSKSCLPASPLVREINGYVQLDRLIVVISDPQMPAALVRHKDSLLTSKSSRGCTGTLLHAVCQGPNVHQSTALDSSAFSAQMDEESERIAWEFLDQAGKWHTAVCPRPSG